MNSLKIAVFVRFPPPFTGQTIGSKLVYDILQSEAGFDVIHCPIEYRRSLYGSKLNPLSAVHQAIDFLKSMRRTIDHLKSNRVDTLYLVASGTKMGILRDAVTFLVLKEHCNNFLVHVRSGNFHHFQSSKSIWGMLCRSNVEKIDGFIFLADSLVKRNIPQVQAKAMVVYNGIDENVEISKEEANVIIDNRDSSRIRLLYLSNMTPTKGSHFILEAIKKLNDDRFLVNFIGAFDNEENENEFRKKVEMLGIGNSVRIHGPISDRNEIKRYYRSSDIFILPTFYPVEAQPRSIIEAMNFGLPIICTPHASIPEMVSFGENAVLIEKQSSDSIVQAINALEDSNARKKFGKRSREIFDSRFSRNVIHKQLTRCFYRVNGPDPISRR